MPRIAMATSAAERIDSDDEASTTRVDDLIQRGRSQGHLSLAELRTAFDQAGLTPAEGRSILRELSESGVRLANELAQARLLTVDGYGHTDLLNPSHCVNGYESSYFVHGALTSTGTICHQDRRPFSTDPQS